MSDTNELGGIPAVSESALKKNYSRKTMREPEPPACVEKGDYITLAAAALLCTLFVRCAVFGGFNCGFTLWYIPFFAVMTCLLRKKEVKPDAFTIFCGAASVVMSVPFSIWCASGIKLVAFLATAVLCALYLGGLSGNILTADGSYVLLFDAFRIMFKNPVCKLSFTVRSFKNSDGSTSRSVLYVTAGVLISLPLVIIVTALLSESDYAFGGLVEHLLESLFELILSLMAGLFITPFAYSAFFALKKSKPVTAEKKKCEKIYRVNNTLVSTILVLMSFVYVVYLFSQTAYFFSAFSGLLPEDFTAAEYARKGFFEMSSVAGVNLAVVLAAYILTRRREDGKPYLLTKILSVFISAFTLVLIATAFSKMYMYIVRFGLTPKRITTSAFMLFLFLVFITVIVMQFKKIPYMKLFAVFAAVVLAAVFWADSGWVSAKYNYEAYTSGALSEFDAFAVRESGYEYLFEYIKDENDIKDRDSLMDNVGCSYIYYVEENSCEETVLHKQNEFVARSIMSERNRELYIKYFSDRYERVEE